MSATASRRRRRNARRLAQKPQVRAAIREMRRQLLPAPDADALYRQLLVVGLDLASRGRTTKRG
jgi:hypothetical protein